MRPKIDPDKIIHSEPRAVKYGVMNKQDKNFMKGLAVIIVSLFAVFFIGRCYGYNKGYNDSQVKWLEDFENQAKRLDTINMRIDTMKIKNKL